MMAKISPVLGTEVPFVEAIVLYVYYRPLVDESDW